jgi:hypothetical protein
MMQSDFFSSARPQEVTLRTGDVLHLPIMYSGATEITAVFTASSARVREALPTERLQPVEIVPGKAVVALAAWEYPHCAQADATLGDSYNELIVLFPVLCDPAFNVPALKLLMTGRFQSYGQYIPRMPVTTEQARDIGTAIWGTPKILADITFTDTERARSCQVRAGGQELLRWAFEKLPVRPRREAFCMYTYMDGELLRWAFETQGEYGSASLRGGASVTLGDHPIAEELRQLRLGSVALERSYARQVQGMLHLPLERIPGRRAGERVAVPAGRQTT